MRQDLTYTTSATAVAGGVTQVRSHDGRLELAISTPAELGGPESNATNAEQLLAAGYAACFLSALQYAAVRRGSALPTDSQVRATIELTQPDRERFAVSIRIEASLPAVEAGLASHLIEEAKVAWPYSEPVIALGVLDEGGLGAQGESETVKVQREASSARGYGG